MFDHLQDACFCQYLGVSVCTLTWFLRRSDQRHVLAVGHSLGGALATLAAFDIRKQLLESNQSDAQVVCYTFAAPRTGNHAFAREFNAEVPDTWSVINDQVSHQKPLRLSATEMVKQRQWLHLGTQQ